MARRRPVMPEPHAHGPARPPAPRVPVPAPDDPLAATLARAVRARANGRVLARVGEKKAGFELKEPAEEGVQDLLLEAFKSVRETHKALKANFVKDKLTNPVGDKKALLADYVNVLKLRDWAEALKDTPPFKDGRLVLKGETIQTAGDKVVATLTRGAAMFEPVPGSEARPLFKKRDKPGDGHYVLDDRNVPTRRYAYVEKSNAQFLEFALSGVMTGRYQRLRALMGGAAELLKLAPKLYSKVFGRTNAKNPLDIKSEHLAALHQFKGSGPEQRGLSLTSTPGTGAVFGNAGDSFHRDDGVRMRVDLAKVPSDVILVNQYSTGGVKDKFTTLDKGKYGFADSALKNRELYLAKLERAWVASVIVYPAGVEDNAGTGEELVTRAATAMHADSYIEGYRAIVADKPAKEGPDSGYTAGRTAGKWYLVGFEDGGKIAKNLSADDLWAQVNVQYGNLPDKRMGGYFDEYWVGWVHAAKDKPKGSHLPVKGD